MSYLEKLMRELCPKGVIYKPLGEVVEIRSGWGFPNSEQGKTFGEIPFYKVSDMNNAGNEMLMKTANNYIDPSTSDRLKCKPAPSGTIIFPKIGAAISTNKKRILTCNACYDNNIMGLITSQDIESRFLYYLVDSIDLIDFADYSGAMPSIRKTTVEKHVIPVPPLPVQREIVRILDKFTKLTAELTAELTARQKQYEYYRNKLLNYYNYDETQKVVCRTLDELCIISAGGDAPKGRMSEEKTVAYKIPIISNGIGTNAIYGYTDEAKITVPAVTIAARGTIGYAEYRDYPYYPIIRLLSLVPRNDDELNTKFLYYCLQGKEYKVPTGGIPQLTAPMLKKEKIVIPPLSIQQKIVEILDRFDAICNDLTSGLPAEIAARQKQYEYYRDKLLTFKAAHSRR